MSAAGDLEQRVAALIRLSAPFAYCDACLARRLAVSPESVRDAALALITLGKEFERVVRICYGCARARDVTALR